MAFGLLGSLFGSPSLSQPPSRTKTSKTVSSGPRNLDISTSTAALTPSNDAATEAQANLHGPRPPSPFTLSTTFDRLRDPSPPVESSAKADLAFTERLASSKDLRVQVDPTHHIHAWLSDTQYSTTSNPLSRNPSVKLKPRPTATNLASQKLRKISPEPSPPHVQLERGNTGTFEPTPPDSATLEMAQAEARIKAFKNSTEYQAYLQDKDRLSSLAGSLAETSLKERIDFFESPETDHVRKRISDFETTEEFKTFLADSTLLEVYSRS